MPGLGPLSLRMRSAIVLTELFVIAIVLALLVTLASVSQSAQLLAAGAVMPIIVLSLVFIRYCRRRKLWGYAGASVLGAVGVCLRIAVSTQPSLEVGGGLPLWVSALYIVLGAAVAVANFMVVLELKCRRA